MPEFLALLPPAEALSRLMDALPNQDPDSEIVATSDALGRVSAQVVKAGEPLPPFSRSTVDGFALFAADTFGASDSLPAYLTVVGEVPMGRAAETRLTRGQAALIHTGGMLPEGADAVVMLEQTQAAREDEIEVLKAVAVGENILLKGEDVQQDEEVLPAGVRLRAAEIGGLMALGIVDIEVTRRPKIGIISSGDEVVDAYAEVQPGQVRDVNSYSLSALITQTGGVAVRYGIVGDQASALERLLKHALKACDGVVITAGSSASTRDLTADAIQKMGSPGVLVHGVNVRPGKPTILGVCEGKPVIGLPGNPVSALVIAGLFVSPVCEYLAGVTKQPKRLPVKARLTINIASQAGRQDYIPVRLEQTEDECKAEPIFYKSNLIFSLSRADGLAVIPADATGVAAGDWVEVQLL
jgi:molybdopterin molybdotransferase